MKKGRKAREWTDEEILDLVTLDVGEFCKKHECSESMFYKAYYKNIKPPVRKCDPLENVKWLLPNISVLLNNGVGAYMKHLSEEQSRIDKSRSDLDHVVEIKNVSEIDISKHYEISKRILTERRICKRAITFVSRNNARLVSLFGLAKIAKEERASEKSKVYKTRVLKEELGEVISK